MKTYQEHNNALKSLKEEVMNTVSEHLVQDEEGNRVFSFEEGFEPKDPTVNVLNEAQASYVKVTAVEEMTDLQNGAKSLVCHTEDDGDFPLRMMEIGSILDLLANMECQEEYLSAIKAQEERNAINA